MTDADTAIQEALWGLCNALRTEFAGDPLQTAWEGHLQYRAARWLLDRGWSLTVGEPGGDNHKIATISFANGAHTVARGSGDCRDSVDLRAARNGFVFNLEVKSYPSVGRKRGRAGMEKGLKKDLRAVTESSSPRVCFVFVADRESYLSMRGQREGNRGPKMKWYVDLPPFDAVRDHNAFKPAAGERILFRFASEATQRVICALWRAEHVFQWHDTEPPW